MSSPINSCSRAEVYSSQFSDERKVLLHVGAPTSANSPANTSSEALLRKPAVPYIDVPSHETLLFFSSSHVKAWPWATKLFIHPACRWGCKLHLNSLFVNLDSGGWNMAGVGIIPSLDINRYGWYYKDRYLWFVIVTVTNYRLPTYPVKIFPPPSDFTSRLLHGNYFRV